MMKKLLTPSPGDTVVQICIDPQLRYVDDASLNIYKQMI